MQKDKFLKLKLKYDLIGIYREEQTIKTILVHLLSLLINTKWIMETKLTIERTGQKNIGFYCSDEDPVPKIFNNLPVHFSVGNEVMIDCMHYRCATTTLDLQVHFGTWISWHGKVPRLEVINETKHISITILEFAILVKDTTENYKISLEFQG